MLFPEFTNTNVSRLKIVHWYCDIEPEEPRKVRVVDIGLHVIGKSGLDSTVISVGLGGVTGPGYRAVAPFLTRSETIIFQKTI